MKKHARGITLAILGFLSLVIVSPIVTEASSTSGTISILGTEGLRVNHEVFATFRFSPGSFEINSGGVITFENLVTMDGHTISIVNAADLPTSIGQVFMCGSPGTVCASILMLHFPGGFGPGGPIGPPVAFVNVASNPSGFSMNGVAGNSLFIAPGQTVALTISAPSGTTLQYMCAIHAWMQGTINVK